MSNAQDVLMGGAGGNNWSWKNVAVGEGFRDKEIVQIGEPKQAKRFGTDELKTWSDGNPVLTVPVTLSFGVDDDRTVWVEQSTEQQRAIAKATVAAKAKGIEVGGRLSIIKSGTEDVGKGNDKNLFTASYVPPGAAASNDVLMGGATSQSAAPGGVDISHLPAEAQELIRQAQAAAAGNSTPPF